MLTPAQRRAIAGDLKLDHEVPGEVERIIATYRAAVGTFRPLTDQERAAGLDRLRAFEGVVKDLRRVVPTLDADMVTLLTRRRGRGGRLAPNPSALETLTDVIEMGRQRYGRGRGRPKAQRDALRWLVARLGLVYQAATGEKPCRAATGGSPFERFAWSVLDAAAPGTKLPDRVVSEVCRLMDENASECDRRLFVEILGKEPVSVESLGLIKK